MIDKVHTTLSHRSFGIDTSSAIRYNDRLRIPEISSQKKTKKKKQKENKKENKKILLIMPFASAKLGSLENSILVRSESSRLMNSSASSNWSEMCRKGSA